LLDLDRIVIEAHMTLPLQRLQSADQRGELHPVIGRGRRAPPQLLLLALVAQHCAPAAGTGVAAARAIAVDLDDLLSHGAACARARRFPFAKRAPAPAAARAPCARPA